MILFYALACKPPQVICKDGVLIFKLDDSLERSAPLLKELLRFSLRFSKDEEHTEGIHTGQMCTTADLFVPSSHMRPAGSPRFLCLGK